MGKISKVSQEARMEISQGYWRLKKSKCRTATFLRMMATKYGITKAYVGIIARKNKGGENE